ncbi:MAG: exodeoxyribonuclease VII large subunit [Dehalococcoidia bacterium]|nr:exodeoxyribonuclease VII large subunit [Dehalococcoidia bacterium]
MQIVPVAQITRYLKLLLEADGFLRDLWVSGEVSNLSRSMAGHLYFTLKDRDGQLKCAFFGERGQCPWLVNGCAVVTHGRASVYEAQGVLQLYVDVIQPEGTGLLHLQLEELKARLAKDGLFDESRKRPLPRFPRRIGVVTSPTGAALRDIIKVLSRRYPMAEVLLAPTQVQGEGAAAGIADGLRVLNSLGDVDVIILARGGGSLEELWAFNEEAVVRAVHASHVPVVTGVGHETDTTLADFAADFRAPTPSAAAMAVVPDVVDIARQVASFRQDLLLRSMASVSGRSEALQRMAGDLRRALPDIEARRQRVDEISRLLHPAFRSHLKLKEARLHGLSLQLESLSPLQTLQRGYAIVRSARDGWVVQRTGQAVAGEGIRVQVSDGCFDAQIAGKNGRQRKITTASGDGLQGVLPLG